ncbi:MAG: lipopolysaccharide kinase InaA family protein [Azoarcus sp.]|nr:lipopolysaccharide kinase InaA family protein [Azoarcus sp.]
MKDFVAATDRALLERHGLADFDSLWNLSLDNVDDPNTGRGGWSKVSRIDLDGHGFYLKRQCNHLTRSFTAPFGEPTFSREFRYIRCCENRNVPVPTVAFFAQRLRKEGVCAILITHALDGWQAFEDWLAGWRDRPDVLRARLLGACGDIARRLHAARLTHGAFYPNHIFLRARDDDFDACLIDLEKVRPLWLGRRDRLRDLDQFFRHARALDEAEMGAMLVAYLGCAPDDTRIGEWLRRLGARRVHKKRC